MSANDPRWTTETVRLLTPVIMDPTHSAGDILAALADAGLLVTPGERAVIDAARVVVALTALRNAVREIDAEAAVGNATEVSE